MDSDAPNICGGKEREEGRDGCGREGGRIHINY